MHTTRSRAAVAVAAMTAGALALSACGDGPSEDSAAADGDGKTTLTVSLFGTFGYEESGLFEQYMAENPDIRIEYESTQGEDKYWPALQTKLNSGSGTADRSEEHTSELQSRGHLVCRLLLEKKKR